jgi:hypothetical protein
MNTSKLIHHIHGNNDQLIEFSFSQLGYEVSQISLMKEDVSTRGKLYHIVIDNQPYNAIFDNDILTHIEKALF